ncbi:MAG TPA: ornithine carbamoyltransferase [Gemmatimonadota bacterium]|nr:ornithine carbamoyltransferase [Gemmatimonadota bacterium]
MTELDRERHFLSIDDWPARRLLGVLDEAARLKSRGRDPSHRPLEGLALGMIFAKSSTRTRVSFETGMFQLGGHALFLSSRDIQLGRGEPIADTARVLSRYVDGVMIRTFAQEDAEELARHADIPVINGLTDLLHPCQVMADVMTVREAFGSDLEGLSVAWIGDGNNMAHSWLHAAAAFGLELRLACPEGYDPDPEILAAASARAEVRLGRDPGEAAAGARVVTTDVWASMGQEDEAERRRRDFEGFLVDEALMERAADDAIFLHCLPAHRGEEVAAGVIDGPRSRVWDEAENRLHAQKAILLDLMA